MFFYCSDQHCDEGSYGTHAATTALIPGQQMYHSHSNPDLSSICYEDPRADYPEHVLKVFKADQTCKYLLIHKVIQYCGDVGMGAFPFDSLIFTNLM